MIRRATYWHEWSNTRENSCPLDIPNNLTKERPTREKKKKSTYILSYIKRAELISYSENLASLAGVQMFRPGKRVSRTPRVGFPSPTHFKIRFAWLQIV